jgi:hypothetical protein
VPDRVSRLATLFRRGGRDGIIMDSYRASNSRVRGALWKALYVQDDGDRTHLYRASNSRVRGALWKTLYVQDG